MSVRTMLCAAGALVLLSAWPANASYVVQGSWGDAWRSYDCGSGTSVWTCSYYFDTYTDAAGEQCVEFAAAASGSQQQQLHCHAVMSRVDVDVQARVNAGGRRVGCLSSSHGSGRLGYTSSVPGLSHGSIPVTVEVHDGVVRVAGNFRYDGVPPRHYLVDVTFQASCSPGSWDTGDAGSVGLVEIDD